MCAQDGGLAPACAKSSTSPGRQECASSRLSKVTGHSARSMMIQDAPAFSHGTFHPSITGSGFEGLPLPHASCARQPWLSTPWARNAAYGFLARAHRRRHRCWTAGPVQHSYDRSAPATLAAQEHNTVSLGDLVSQTFTGFWPSSPPTRFCLCLPSEADNSEDRSMADVPRQAARVPPPPPPPVRKPTVQEKRVKQIRKKDGKSRDCKEPFSYESRARSAPHPPPGSTCVNELLHGRACPRTRLCAISASHVGLGIVRPRFTTHFACSCDVHLGLAGGFLLHVLALRNPESVTVPWHCLWNVGHSEV